MIDKLSRIWLPMGMPRENIEATMDGTEHQANNEKFLAEHPNLYDESYRQWLANDRSSYLRLSADIDERTQFNYIERYNWFEYVSTEPFPSDEEEPGFKFYGYMGLIRIWDDDWEGELYVAGLRESEERLLSRERRVEFATRWLPVFRRNAWLSGCKIECTREEREQWIAGVSTKDIQEWGLQV